ncbi:MAG: hypothetical protein MJZ33_09765 [Paludibacteraceae bacterium]|nr:hypothetical protein [Paludibacteraceae bacterium]
MKKILYALTLCTLTACNSKPSASNDQNEIVMAEPDCTSDMTLYTERFAQAYLDGDLKKALTFFSPSYVEEQHDGMLGGRTEQFISEFLGSGIYTDANGEEKYVSWHPNNIVSITVVSVDCNGNPKITVKIALKNGEIYEEVLDTEMVDTENGPKPMFVGAFG